MLKVAYAGPFQPHPVTGAMTCIHHHAAPAESQDFAMPPPRSCHEISLFQGGLAGDPFSALVRKYVASEARYPQSQQFRIFRDFADFLGTVVRIGRFARNRGAHPCPAPCSARVALQRWPVRRRNTPCTSRQRRARPARPGCGAQGLSAVAEARYRPRSPGHRRAAWATGCGSPLAPSPPRWRQ